MTDPLAAYTTHSRSTTGLSAHEWTELASFLDERAAIIDRIRSLQGIEEEPPTINEGQFEPRGWIGSYPGDVEVKSDRLPNQVDTMLEESRGLIESLGLGSAELALPFAPDVLYDARALYLTYSRRLVELTEALGHGRLPVAVNHVRDVGPELRGRPAFDELMQYEAQGRSEIVSRRTEFAFDTPANRLLIAFHRELSLRLRSLTTALGGALESVNRQLAYHADFLETELPAELQPLRDQPDLLTDLDLGALSETATDEVAELVSLWEAYQSQRVATLDPAERFDSAIKPLSKVYELWVFRQIVTILEDAVGEWTIPSTGRQRASGLPSVLRFGDRVDLYYERSVAAHSQHVTTFFRAGIPQAQAGAPDFLIIADGEVEWVGDAKFQQLGEIDLAGTQRFLSYITDYLPSNGGRVASILCLPADPRTTATLQATSAVELGPQEQASIKVAGNPVSMLPCTPTRRSSLATYLEEILESL